ncbi:MAG: hypothetical protein HY071_03270 [Chloroflexi bacterium]|nr:hypothetical protein [Chloroflexota bacterium]
MTFDEAFASLRSADQMLLRATGKRLASTLAGAGIGVGVLGLAIALSSSGATTFEAASVPAATATLAAVVPPLVPVPVMIESAVPVAPTAVSTVAPATPPPTAAPSAAPAVGSAPSVPHAVSASAYRWGGHRYAGLSVEPGTVLTATRGGTVEVRLYQIVNGDIRIGANLPSLPYYPYIYLSTADGKVTYRPGALGVDAEVLVKDGDVVREGDALLKVIGSGGSSWRTFYDRDAAFDVIVSLVTASGTELDPTSLIAAR